MRGVYNCQAQITSVSTSRTLAYITAPSGKVVEILSASVTDANITAAEQLDIGFGIISSLGTPTATSITPRPTEKGDQAAGSTTKVNVTASEPTYTGEPFTDRQSPPNTSGYFYDPLPEERPIIQPGDSYGLKLLTAPGNTYTFNVNLRFREIG